MPGVRRIPVAGSDELLNEHRNIPHVREPLCVRAHVAKQASSFNTNLLEEYGVVKLEDDGSSKFLVSEK